MKLNLIINKLLGAGMLFASMMFFAQGRGEMAGPGLLFGIAGLVLVLRRERVDETPREPSDLRHRLERVEDVLATTHVELGIAQKQIDQLLEERDFMRQLLESSAQAPAKSLAR